MRGVSFDLDKGETLALVGEIGLGQIGDGAVDPAAPALSRRDAMDRESSITLRRARSSCGAPQAVLRRIRGNRIAMVFQEPMTSLNPLHTIEKQITETLHLHKHMTRRGGAARAPSSCCISSACPRPRAGSTPIRISSRAASGSG